MSAVPDGGPAPLVQDVARWRAVAARLAEADRLAVDLEADSFHNYPEQVALLQLALPDGSRWLIDPLALDDLSPLGAALADPARETVFHAADYDLRSLDRDYGFHVDALFDTAIAAQFTGAEKTGLANVLEDVLAVEIPKSRRLQLMDWSRRPLPDDALRYAAADVDHLLSLADVLRGELERLGRLSWVREECARQAAVRYDPPDPPEEAFLSLKGARDLTDRGRAVLRELYVFREAEAHRLNTPPHKVIRNRTMIRLAQTAPTAKLKRVPGIMPRTLGERGEALRIALSRGHDAEPVPLPRHRGRNPWTPELRERLSALKQWRRDAAARLPLDVGLTWPADHLERVALHPDRPSEALDRENDVRQWQWAELGEDLERFRAKTLGDPSP